MIEFAPGSGLKLGDVITISGRPAWWRRLFIWLRIMKPRRFEGLWEVTAVTDGISFQVKRD